MEKLTRAAQALSDQTRLRILNLVMSRECCVCEVMQALEITQTRASRNLKILCDAGFLNARTDGLYTFYTIHHSASNGIHAKLLDAVKKEMESDKEARKNILRLNKSRRFGPGCGSQLISANSMSG